MQYIDNIKKWTRASLEANIRLAADRRAWHEISCAAGAANVRTDDADKSKVGNLLSAYYLTMHFLQKFITLYSFIVGLNKEVN